MPAASSTINRLARALMNTALAHGIDRETLCRTVEIPLDFDPANHPLDQASFARLSRQLKLIMQDEFCGMTPTRCKIGTYQLMLELLLSSRTLEEALSKAFRFYELITDDIGFTLRADSEFAVIGMHVAHPEVDRYNYLFEWWFMLWTSLMRWLVGEEIPVLTVDFPHAQEGAIEEYAETFSSNCRFSRPEARLVFRREYLRRPTVRSIEDISDFLFPRQDGKDVTSLVELNLGSRIRRQLRAHFREHHQFPAMEEIAERYHMCPQTLRRRLEDVGTSFRAIKEEIRRELAMALLKDETIPINEISRLCGFAEPNGLSRAMKTWVGRSPLEQRRAMLGQATGTA